MNELTLSLGYGLVNVRWSNVVIRVSCLTNSWISLPVAERGKELREWVKSFIRSLVSLSLSNKGVLSNSYSR